MVIFSLVVKFVELYNAIMLESRRRKRKRANLGFGKSFRASKQNLLNHKHPLLDLPLALLSVLHLFLFFILISFEVIVVLRLLVHVLLILA